MKSGYPFVGLRSQTRPIIAASKTIESDQLSYDCGELEGQSLKLSGSKIWYATRSPLSLSHLRQSRKGDPSGSKAPLMQGFYRTRLTMVGVP